MIHLLELQLTSEHGSMSSNQFVYKKKNILSNFIPFPDYPGYCYVNENEIYTVGTHYIV